MEAFVQLLVAGIFGGVSYGVLAVGLTLILGVMRIINFAHASFAVLAMYLPAFWFLNWWKLDPFISAVVALPMFFVLGYLVQRVLIERVLGDSGFETRTVIMTMGFSLLIQNLILIVWSGAPRIIFQPYTLATWRFGKILVNHAQTYSLFISLLLIIGLFIFLNKTILGKGLRAAADDPESCAYMGINLRAVYGIAFGLGIAITAAGGCLMATYRPFNPFYGDVIMPILFASVVLGGMGSITGAFIGSLIISIIRQVSTLIVSTSLQDVAVFVVFVLFLYLRPHGLLGKKGRMI
jgi:branched-chain amino acid transport system permease protein